ncbi:kinase-like protein [Trametopsis cervina]|nr:kinase-like protein [Trametopsis cervina]
MGFTSFVKGIKSLGLIKTPVPQQEDAFVKVCQQSPQDLEFEFITAIAVALEKAASEENKSKSSSVAASEEVVSTAAVEYVTEADTVKSAATATFIAADNLKADEAEVSPTVVPTTDPTRIICRDDFEIIRFVGEGSQGKVFLALDTKTEQFVTLKIVEKIDLTARSCAGLFEEQRIGKSLVDCPWALGLKGSFEDSVNFYLVTDYQPGGDLTTNIEHHGSFGISAQTLLLADLIVAVEALHSRRIIHRDIKPDNILIDANGRVVLADFNLSKAFGVDPQERPWEQYPAFSAYPAIDSMVGITGDVSLQAVGTPGFVAPEVIRGDAHSYAADIFSVGIVAHWLLYSCVPFGIDTCTQSLTQIIDRTMNQPLDFSECNDRNLLAEDLLQRMLAKDPSQRASLSELKNHPFFDGIYWGYTQTRNTTDAHKQAVFRYIPPNWVSASQIPSAGEAYIPGKVGSEPREVNLTGFNPLILPTSTAFLAPVITSSNSTSTFVHSSPALSFSTDTSSVVSSPRTPEVEVQPEFCIITGDTPSASPLIPDIFHKDVSSASAGLKSFKAAQTVAWWAMAA